MVAEVLECNVHLLKKKNPPRVASRHKPTSSLLLKPLRDSAPVNNLPDGAEVLSLAVLVLQIVCVLPGVDSEKRLEIADDRILIGSSNQSKSTRGLVLDKPGPSRALNSSESSIGLLL